MELQKCAKCKTRPAVVYISRIENGETKSEGLCFVCAKELGIKPVTDMLSQMGVSEEELEQMTEEVEEFMAVAEEQAQVGGESEEVVPSPMEEEQSRTPTIDFARVFEHMGMTPSTEPEEKRGRGSGNLGGLRSSRGGESRKFLSTYCTNLNERAKQGKLDRMIGRDRELARMIQILCRRQKNNPCLIGEPGVGKTAIAEALAQRIVSGDVPFKLQDHEVWLLDLTALVAGSQFRGQFEARIQNLIKEIKAAGKIILVIDEVHNIVGAGDAEGGMNAANILKPALSRGEIQVIGATTLKEYRKYIEKDSALERRFQPIMISEPSIDDATDIITGIRNYYEEFHGVKIPIEIARSAVVLSERYITDRFLPDKAIDLIDEAASRASLDSKELNELRSIERRLSTLNKEREETETKLQQAGEGANALYKKLADLKVEILNLEERASLLRESLNGFSITQDHLASVIEIWTGIPASDIRRDELSQLAGLYDRISSQLIGQEEAVSAVCRAVKRKRAGISYRHNPVSMIFAGPTGVGKTELVKVLSSELFKQPEALIRLDMSEFMEKHAVSRIIGAPPGYVGYDEAGQLTEKIRRRPYSVVLFDEIEKAHPDVLNILLQILDDGKITDAQGRVVNFENTIIILTTNAGSQNSTSVSGFGKEKEQTSREKTERALSSFLRPEFINRIDEIITFRHLNLDDFKKIAGLMMKKLADFMKDEKGITITYDDDVLSHIAEKSFSEKFGARNMRRFVEREIEDRLAELIIASTGNRLLGVHYSIRDGELICLSI